MIFKYSFLNERLFAKLNKNCILDYRMLIGLKRYKYNYFGKVQQIGCVQEEY